MPIKKLFVFHLRHDYKVRWMRVTVRSCRYGAVLKACQMAIDADLNGVIANVRNGVGH